MLQKIFGFDPRTMTVKKEIIAGITTFLTMAYILAVNPNILSATGMDKGAIFTTTIISAFVGTAVMAIYAKLPFVLAPGMGLNAFFTYSVCFGMGFTWQQGLAIVFISGIVFLIITALGLDSTTPYEGIGSFGLGIVFGMIVIGVIFTSRYAVKIREFKLRLLGKAREGKR